MEVKKQVFLKWANLCDDEPGIDIECLSLCEAINKFHGAKTISSCCGHGHSPFRIWFEIESLDNLAPIIYYFDNCHSGCHGWNVIAKTDCSMQRAKFMVESSKKGEEAYKEAAKIAIIMEEWLANKKSCC